MRYRVAQSADALLADGVELSHVFLAEALHWACMAGRSREELEAAVKEDGTKMFDYIHVAPIRLRGE
jgi:hypothetical protein